MLKNSNSTVKETIFFLCVAMLRFLVAIGCQSKLLILHDYFSKNYEFIPYLKINFKSHKEKKSFLAAIHLYR